MTGEAKNNAGRAAERAVATGFLLRESLQRNLPPGKFIEWHGWRAHDFGVVRHIIEDGTFGRDLDAMADF